MIVLVIMWQIHTYSKQHFDVSMQNIHATYFIKRDFVWISLYTWFKLEKNDKKSYYMM